MDPERILDNQRAQLARQTDDLTASEQEYQLAKELGAPNTVLWRIHNKIQRQKQTRATTKAYLDLLEAKVARKSKTDK